MIKPLPPWFRQKVPDEITLERANLLSSSGVHTVCQEAVCPNISDCFKQLRFTFLILGDTCTRNCAFCGVKKSSQVKRLNLDLDEPYRIAEVIKNFGLNYVVITSVARDDLADGGAWAFVKTIQLIHKINSNIRIELLIPDFQGNVSSLKSILNTQPEVVAHNIETVFRLHKYLKPQADYQLSLDILKKIKELNSAVTTKSSLLLGLGETEQEVITTMEDLNRSHCDILTLGQYLNPSCDHYPVKEFLSLDQFQIYQKLATGLGFKAVLSGPLVRSSYSAEEMYRRSFLNFC